MSEAEKKKRYNYRKNREKWIFAQAVLVAILTVAVLISSIVAYRLNSTYYVEYKESGSIDYNVFLKENEFYDKDYLEKDQSYVASLIDHIVTNFSYELDMDADDVNYRYSYSIKSRLEIIDNTSNVAIFNPEYDLVVKEDLVQNSSNRLTINEIVYINYDEYNSLASKFLETYDLSSTTSNIVVTLKVDVLSNCNAFIGGSVDTYTSELRIPLTTKTVNIQMNSMVPGNETNMIACNGGASGEVFKTTAIVLGVVDAILILALVAFTYLTRTEDITYTARVKRIVSQYKSYIQKINNLFDSSTYQVIMVNTFDEMLEIRDTIQAPILMFENADKTCTKFMIPTDSKLLYTYEIKIEGYTEPEAPKSPDPAPTTIVKPNITNVVRPVVKVVLTPPAANETEAEVSTVVEDAEIEAENCEDINVSVEVEEELDSEDLEIEDILASIPSADDNDTANTVEAIDVVWGERTTKSYRYDPDGNNVESGDIVLVPTRDEANDKEVIREAEVSRSNYKIDSAELEHPLKKIIGVVRRRAEKVFTAMITPDDETTDKQ